MKIISKTTKETVGKIRKEFSGFKREMFSDADFYRICLSTNVEPVLKGLFIAAVLFIVNIKKRKIFNHHSYFFFQDFSEFEN